MALPAQQYRTFRDLFRIMLSVSGVPAQDSDVLSFFKQLLADSVGATPLSTSRNFLCGEIFRRILSGNASNPSDADVASFWTQFATDASSSVAMGQTVIYRLMFEGLRGAISCDGLNPTPADVLGYFSAYGFSGNFSALFTSPYYFAQADRGLTYGSTPRATAGNTSATVLTIAGPTPATPVPVLVKATNSATVGSGATFNIYYDGTGTTPAMTGVLLTGTPTALTGAGAGLTLAASVAASVNNDTWNATAASFVDQSGNGFTWSQASASAQPIVTVGVNGHVGILFDSIDDFLSSAFNPIAGMMSWIVLRQITWTGFKTIIGCGDNVNKMAIFQDGFTVSPQIAAYNGAELNGGNLTLGTIGRVTATHNGVTSSIKVGSNAVANGSEGTTALGVGRGIGCDRWNAAPVNFSNIEVFGWGEMPAQSGAAADSAAASYWGAAT